jgi:acyl dehydratase
MAGSPSPVHFDDAFARSVGLPGIIVHGLCTMAMTGGAVIKTVAEGDPGGLVRLAVRFSSNVFPGSDLTTHVYGGAEDRGCRSYAFEAFSRGRRVVSNGRADIRSAR